MAYYLSARNKSLILPILKLLQYPEKGEVILPANSSRRLEYILRNAANTEHPELKRWIFKRRESHVVCIPKDIIVSVALETENEYLDYLSLIQYIIFNNPVQLKFTNAYLTERELEKFQQFCIQKDYIFDNSNGLTIKKNGI